jgi:molybdopterin synthase catalytic subunit
MAEILRDARTSAVRNEHAASDQPHNVSSLVKCAAYHRLGTVPVGEPSIVIAVSSPHRKEAFVACEYILEEIKAKAQIWKREYYEGEEEGEAEWKANRA